MTILVTGATSSTGRQVISNLLTLGQQVRALTRNPDSAGLPAGTEVAQGDLRIPATLRAVLEGIESIYLVPVLDGFDEFVDLAKQTGARRVVLLSRASAAGETRRAADHASDFALPVR